LDLRSGASLIEHPFLLGRFLLLLVSHNCSSAIWRCRNCTRIVSIVASGIVNLADPGRLFAAPLG
jgi:hypothetical protein